MIPVPGALDSNALLAYLRTSPVPLADADQRFLEPLRLAAAGWSVDRVIVAVCGRLGVNAELLRVGRRTDEVSRAREAVAALASGPLGATQVTVARATGVSRQAITQAVGRFASWPPDQRHALLRLFDDGAPVP